MQRLYSRKILYVITKSNFGGAQKQLYELALASKSQGASVFIAAGGTGERGATSGLLFEKLVASGVHTIFLPHFMRDMSLFDDWRAFLSLIKHIRRIKPDVLHVTSSKAGGLGSVAGRLCGVPLVLFTSHGLTFDESWRPAWQRVVIKIFTWLTCLFAHKTIVITSNNAERLKAMPFLSKKIELIHNGIERPVFLGRSEARSSLVSNETLRAHKDNIWAVTIGELTRNKNHRITIEAIAAYNAQNEKKIFYTIVGSGEEEKDIIALSKKLQIGPYINLIGYLDDASTYLSAFDIFILTSLKEGLPYVILEAGLAKLPVIASDIPGNTEILTDNETGILIRPDTHQLAKALGTLVGDDELQYRLGNNLFTHVEHRFSLKNMVEQTLALYTKR